MNIITVVYEQDLANLLYQAYSLSKNWLGEKTWIIVIEDKYETKIFVESRIVPVMVEWEVVVLMSPHMKAPSWGWQRQQICKLWAASEICKSEYALMLDAKNFLINPTDETFFFNNGKVKIQEWNTNQLGDQTCDTRNWKNFCNFFGKDSDKLTQGCVTTPWVWKKELVKLTIKEFANRGYVILQDELDLPVWEFDAYWIVSQTVTDWTNSEFGDAIWFATDTVDRPVRTDLPFWTCHRRAFSNVDLLDFNNKLLLEKDIITEELITEHADIRDNHNPFVFGPIHEHTMNEQLNKLHEQALSYANDASTARFKYMTYTDKFAKLIVQECISNLELNGYDDAITVIEQHFGIKSE